MRRHATTASKQNFDAMGLCEEVMDVYFCAEYQRSDRHDSRHDADRSYQAIDKSDDIDVRLSITHCKN